MEGEWIKKYFIDDTMSLILLIHASVVTHSVYKQYKAEFFCFSDWLLIKRLKENLTGHLNEVWKEKIADTGAFLKY